MSKVMSNKREVILGASSGSSKPIKVKLIEGVMHLQIDMKDLKEDKYKVLEYQKTKEKRTRLIAGAWRGTTLEDFALEFDGNVYSLNCNLYLDDVRASKLEGERKTLDLELEKLRIQEEKDREVSVLKQKLAKLEALLEQQTSPSK